MPHGTPDWGLVGPKDTTYGLDDLGEHAVRLGSPHLWDRRGDVIWQTAFDEGLEGATPDVTAGNNFVRLWTGRARQGPYCARVDVEAGLLEHAALLRYLPFPVTSGMGCEFSFFSVPEAGFWYIIIEARDEGAWYEGRVRIDETAGAVEYYDDTGNYVLLETDLRFVLESDYWHTMKLVTMFDQGRYARMILDDEVVDMGHLNLYTAGAAGSKRLLATVGKSGDALEDTYGYIDNVIVTQNEP